MLVPFFANLGKVPEKYLLLYTKSDNVQHLLGLDHGGRTIVNWSLSPRTQAALIEKNTPPVERRLQAMRACEGAGYTVRARLSPVIPVDGWRDEYTDLIDGLFQSVSPDVVTIDVLGFMSPAGMKASLDMSLFDAEARGIIESLINKHKKWQKHVFPADYRQEIYQFLYKEIRKHDETVPVTMCNEEFSLWESCAESWQPRMEVEDYVCCCGPSSVPGNKWLKKREN